MYSVLRAPDDWPDVATLIDNNYRNMHARDVKTKGREVADEESVPFLGAAVLVHIFGAFFGRAYRQCLEINKPRSSHAGVRVTRGLLHPNIGQHRHDIRRLDSTDTGDAEGGW